MHWYVVAYVLTSARLDFMHFCPCKQSEKQAAVQNRCAGPNTNHFGNPDIK